MKCSIDRFVAWCGGVVVLSLLAAGCSNGPYVADGGAAGGAHALDPVTTTAELSEAVNVPRPVLVDFYADWCGPCKQQAPVLAKLKADYAGRVDFYRVDVDHARDLASEYGIRSIPTLLLFKDGRAVKRLIGYHSREQLQAELNALTG